MENIKTKDHTEEVTSIYQSALRAGVILGLISMSISFLAYFIDFTLLASGWMAFGSFLVMIAVVIYFGIDYRKEIGGFMSFGTAYKFSFITLVVSVFISSIANILLFNVIDPNLPQTLGDVQLENTLAIMDRYGAGDAMSSDMIDEMRTSLYDNYSIFGIIKTFGILVLISAFISLILGAIIKKRDKSLEY
ncbi:DUF4199 domain-containing protein [Anditalea andensis]|uniref:DUF4199 domain-containing protein n=1 Tax=Anditalea andensis TaxID=1048983 RepID=A0A074LNS3_9BACT|nr:DUF4199 domain-containing protein [Anditalea andensis]KEO75567.1 hypothetical protein EL17_00290 [Anditalea andensis]